MKSKLLAALFVLAMAVPVAFAGGKVTVDPSFNAPAQQQTVRRKRKPGLARSAYRGGKWVTVRVYKGGKWVTKRVWRGGKWVGKKSWKSGRKVVSRSKKILY